MGFRYKICKGRTIYALATTLREAEQEARRIGGKVVPLKAQQRNPSQIMEGWVPPTEEEFARWEAEAEEENRRGREKEAARMQRKMGEWGYAEPKDMSEAGDLDFPYRPSGHAAKPKDTKQFKTYLFTILSPKCQIPLAIYGDPVQFDVNWYYASFSVDRQSIYAIGYLDSEEYSQQGYVRQHMQPGLLNYGDMGTGLGAAMYEAGPLVASVMVDPDLPGTFSPKTPAPIYVMRTGAADKAWKSLVKHKVAQEVNETPKRVVQQMDKQTVLDLGVILHAAPATWRIILEGAAPRAGMSYVPPALGWEHIDLSTLPEKNLKEMLAFCEKNSDEDDYRENALDAIAANPSSPYDPVTLEGLLSKRRNPYKRPNPEQQRKAAAWKKMISDKGWE